jgi:hypothetical protein
MSISLAEALEPLNLTPGTYRLRLKEHDIEIRVVERKAGEPIPVARYDESDVMLEPWVQLPTPQPAGTVIARPAPPPPPDIPEIPGEDEGSGSIDCRQSATLWTRETSSIPALFSN